ncbi:MAG: LUD domain-containing protein [Minisyncoccales bacterium]
MITNQSFLKPETKSVIWQIVLEYRKKREKALLKNNLEREKFREEIYQLKKNTLAQIKELKKKTIANLKENGIEVFEAKDSQEAREQLKKILEGKKKIIKAKTNTFSEIETEEFLTDKELTETDLGDFLVQIFEQEEIHPVLPALHLTPEKISQKIKEKFGKDIEARPEAIANFVRNFLREKISQAEVGISGANAITTDGKILILENEGNISLVSRWPEIHIVMAGFEKIVENLEAALKIVKAAAIWGTGQTWPVYISIIAGPSQTADIQNQTVVGAQGAKKVYLILLDNGRSKLLQEGFEEILYCLNCGACLNFCPVFHQIGRNYGDRYLGSKGIIFAGLSESFKKAVEANCFACTLCSACFENCPAKINLPELMKKLRSFMDKENLQTKENQEMIEKIRQFGNPFGKIEEGKIPKKLYCC